MPPPEEPAVPEEAREAADAEEDEEYEELLEPEEAEPSFEEEPEPFAEEALAPEPAPEPEAPPDSELEPEPELESPELLAETAPEAEIDKEQLDPDGLKVVQRLRRHGHEAYFVGGCVRDLLVGCEPKDFDVATSAHPEEVRAIFRNCRLIGRRFRLAHVYFKGGKIIEVSTFRANPTEVVEETPAVEGEGTDDLLISDDNVFGTAEQDARRRDFTINGLFYDVGTGKVIDYVRGRRDLQEGFVRTIGDPEIRMREDPVRLLRAVRFASKLGFDIESRTYAAMEGAVEDLPRCAPPRLLEDTFRLFRSGLSAKGIHLLDALGALKVLLPPLAAWLEENGDEGRARFRAVAEALDRKVKSGAVLEDAVLLATLLLPISQGGAPESAEPGGRLGVAQPIEELLSELVRVSRLPRRIAERCRMILFAQATLAGKRRRRGPLQAFRKHPLFTEALTVFSLWTEATGENREAQAAWASGSAPEVAPGAAGGRKRRRRRRRGGKPSGDAPRTAPESLAAEPEG